jgi:hypothetical protein
MDEDLAPRFDTVFYVKLIVQRKKQPLVRYYGHYLNVARGKRKKQDRNDLIPHTLERSAETP